MEGIIANLLFLLPCYLTLLVAPPIGLRTSLATQCFLFILSKERFSSCKRIHLAQSTTFVFSLSSLYLTRALSYTYIYMHIYSFVELCVYIYMHIYV